ncbi:MAG: Rieske (2Fe-2S) protein [Planctomycetes bacterium]|nr:Rieske (2Fe-2S) protein [Planctomycetota bacterium]
MSLLWQRVASLEEVEPGCGIRTSVDGEPIVLFRIGESLSALGARCPHQGGFLGTDLVEESTAVCPSHGWAFDARTGEHLHFRGVRVPAYRTRVRDGSVFVRRTLLGSLRALLRPR